MSPASLALIYWRASSAARRGRPLTQVGGLRTLADLARYPSPRCPRVAQLARRALVDRDLDAGPALDTLPDGAA